MKTQNQTLFDDTIRASTGLGRAFHGTIAHNFRQKQETVRDLPVAECLDCFRKVLGPLLEEAKLQKGEHPMELLELGETMVTKYIEDAAPLIRPAAVESRVSGVIGGVKVSGYVVSGYVDLLDIERRIIDFKSALKPLKGIVHDHQLQLTSYVMITPTASGTCRVGHRDKGEDSQPDSREFLDQREGQALRRNDLSDGPGFDPWGIFLPRRSSPLCSRRFCGLWNVCEKEYGGSVRCD